jgi:hypothetical protein
MEETKNNGTLDSPTSRMFFSHTEAQRHREKIKISLGIMSRLDSHIMKWGLIIDGREKQAGNPAA